MVFCRQCRKNVDECEHFVPPLGVPAINVFDEKVRTIAYSAEKRILEVCFKTGQVWQLFGVPPGMYRELCDSTISSFLRFIAHRYNARPVKHAVENLVAASESCPQCGAAMTRRHSTAADGSKQRVLWACSKCAKTLWRNYDALDPRGPRKPSPYESDDSLDTASRS
jgi:ribosomal protein S27AE